jgi:hypothetical protein
MPVVYEVHVIHAGNAPVFVLLGDYADLQDPYSSDASGQLACNVSDDNVGLQKPKVLNRSRSPSSFHLRRLKHRSEELLNRKASPVRVANGGCEFTIECKETSNGLGIKSIARIAEF